jgi:hypothetical protein
VIWWLTFWPQSAMRSVLRTLAITRHMLAGLDVSFLVGQPINEIGEAGGPNITLGLRGRGLPTIGNLPRANVVAG